MFGNGVILQVRMTWNAERDEPVFERRARDIGAVQHSGHQLVGGLGIRRGGF